MLSRVHSMGLRGVNGYPVLVELDLAQGLPSYSTVGLPDSAVKESRERVASAVRNSGYSFPPRRVVVNLAPAQSKKEGTHFDLPIAVALLSASNQIASEGWAERFCFIGELSLDGALRPVRGVVAMAASAREKGFEAIIVPAENAAEAQAAGIAALPCRSLREVSEFLSGPKTKVAANFSSALEPVPESPVFLEDLSDVKGQLLAKRALEIAAAGGHNVLLIGPPGAGKSMLAARLATILPALEPEEALEVARIHSLSTQRLSVSRRRPFRAPHHTASAAALVGGGPAGRPGEVSLAHRGVLFLDELGEFSRHVLESLRQPLEEGKAVVSRAKESFEYPARFCLIAATNPCPCGFRGHPIRSCSCNPARVERYLGRLSGPLLDRIDLQVEMAPVAFSDWEKAADPGQNSAGVRARVAAARRFRRSEGSRFVSNAELPAAELRSVCALDGGACAALERASAGLGLSARGLDRVLRVSRTIADLEQSPAVGSRHIAEAVQFRALEKMIAPLI